MFPHLQRARRDSNPQPPVLETGALPLELQTLQSNDPRPGVGRANGQGRSRTADTVIFSHVLYQLSYLARQQKTARTTRVAGGDPAGVSRLYRLPAPARGRGLHVSATVQDRRRDASRLARAKPHRQLEGPDSSMIPPDRLNVGNAARGGASGQIAGAGFEPATFGL